MTDQDNVQSWPLSWPSGWKRTTTRQEARFHKRVVGVGGFSMKSKLTVGDALSQLNGELRRLGASRIVISSNLQIKENGQPYAAQARKIDDPGVAVYFRLSGKPRVLACDRWRSAADNIAAIAAHIDCIRAEDRYGVGTLDQAFAGYTALPSVAGVDWRLELGLGQTNVTLAAVNEAYRRLARLRHPDSGGTDESMARLNEARAAALVELGGEHA